MSAKGMAMRTGKTGETLREPASIAAKKRRRCPLCGNDRFHLQGGAGLVFLVVLADGRILVDGEAAPRSLPEGETVGCTTCAWSGHPTELLAD